MEFGSAGTLARWADAGADITLCIATDGSTGTQDQGLMGQRLSDLRKEESRAAADVVGINDLVWLDYRDGYVEYTLDLRKDIARVFRRYKPHVYVVIDWDPTIEDRFINHPDHRAVGQASLDVSMTAGTTPGHFPELLDEGLLPWRGLRELWVAGPAGGSRVVDISDVIERKIDALKCHGSQVGDDIDEISNFVRRYTAEAGAPHGFAHAESFRVISEGPGFHAGEQDEDVDLGDLATAPTDLRA